MRILPGINLLKQHLLELKLHPESYRPDYCPHCGINGIWNHGHYLRKADREGEDGTYLDPVPIPRYYCIHCKRSCSRLPSCIPPHRWYLWVVQQAVLTAVLSGTSFRRTAHEHPPAHRTIARWMRWLENSFTQHSLHLQSRFSVLGRHDSLASFWLACFQKMSLAEAVTWLERDGMVIP